MLDAVKASPGEHKASGTGQGGIWHLALAGMLEAKPIAPNAAPWVPSQGAAPGLQDLVAGGVDIVTCSVPEAQALLEGAVKSLAVMSGAQPHVPDVPTLKEATGSTGPLPPGAASPPADMPQEVVDVLVPVLKEIHDGQEFRDFMAQRGFGVWRDPRASASTWRGATKLGSVMKAVGIANRGADAAAAGGEARVRINDAVIGAVLVLFALAMWHTRTFPAMPGQDYGPAAFPVLIGIGFHHRVDLDRAACAGQDRGMVRGGSGCAPALTWPGSSLCSAASSSTSWSPAGWASSRPRCCCCSAGWCCSAMRQACVLLVIALAVTLVVTTPSASSCWCRCRSASSNRSSTEPPCPVWQKLRLVLDPYVILVLLLASVFGLIGVGALPGLTATMATALLVPLTFFMEPVPAIGAIIAASAMAIFAGDISGTLLRIPGTPASAAYVEDAYRMTGKGQAEPARRLPRHLGDRRAVRRRSARLLGASARRVRAQVQLGGILLAGLLRLSCAVFISTDAPVKAWSRC